MSRFDSYLCLRPNIQSLKSEGTPEHWPERKHAIVELLKRFEPDILCVQEAHPALQAAVQVAVPVAMVPVAAPRVSQ